MSDNREAFEKFASELGYSVERDGTVYGDSEVHLMWIGYRRCKEQHLARTPDTRAMQSKADAWDKFREEMGIDGASV
jgi:hypothetical protein